MMPCSGLNLFSSERLSTFNFSVLSSHVDEEGIFLQFIIVFGVAGGNTPSCQSLKKEVVAPPTQCLTFDNT